MAAECVGPESRQEALLPASAPEAELDNRLASDQVQPHDRFFQALVDALPSAIYATDAEGRIIFYNEAAARLWGRLPRLGEDWWCGSWRLFHPDGRPMAHDECPMAVALKTGKAVRGAEAVAERPDGTRFPFIPYPNPLYDRSGKLVGAVNMLVDISAQKNGEHAGRHYLAIVESSNDAIVSKTLDGIIQTWNKAAERIFGYSAEEIVGKSILLLIPEDRHHEESAILSKIQAGERLEHYETVRLRKDGTLLDLSLTISPVKDESGRIVGASKIARDITEKKRAERLLQLQTKRLKILNRVAKEISRDLDLDRIVQAMTDLATEVSGAEFGAFFYNVVDERGESYQLYTLSAVPRSAFERFPMPRNTAVFGPTFRGEAIIRSDDIRKDPRYGKNSPYFGMPEGHLPVVSYLAVPVVSSGGEVLGGLFFGHSQSGVFTEDAEALMSAIAAQAAMAIDNARLHRAAQNEIQERKRAESARELLLHEIKHRVKNTLATVQAMAAQTFREAPPAERKAFVARLQALAEAHDVLTQKHWASAEARETIERAMAPFRDGRAERIALAGPSVELPPNKALLIAMFLHELGTNAVKYGALSNPLGKVEVRWRQAGQPKRPQLVLEWDESGGPAVTPPSRQGFGTRMIERALQAEGGSAKFDFRPEGLLCTMTIGIDLPQTASPVSR
ncbi:MAG TPA: PAS domain S-box protein [Rhizomicrobium sp.]|nr:PAS domain S-box protein [Rhizomicrobium sp.]